MIIDSLDDPSIY